MHQNVRSQQLVWTMCSNLFNTNKTLVIYKTVIDVLKLVVTELSKLQAYRTFRAGFKVS